MKKTVLILSLLLACVFTATAQDYIKEGEESLAEGLTPPLTDDYPDKDTDKGVIINGVTWATRNVDSPGTFAARPEDTGMFYQWNRRKGWSATGTVSGWDDSMPWGDKWERTNDPCPAGWRVPTVDELKLLEDVYSEWTTVNGVSGRRFGYGSNSIFLPASGYRYTSDGVLYTPGVYGHYWSSTPSGTSNGYNVSFNSTTASTAYNDYRSYGFSVRCVAE